MSLTVLAQNGRQLEFYVRKRTFKDVLGLFYPSFTNIGRTLTKHTFEWFLSWLKSPPPPTTITRTGSGVELYQWIQNTVLRSVVDSIWESIEYSWDGKQRWEGFGVYDRTSRARNASQKSAMTQRRRHGGSYHESARTINWRLFCNLCVVSTKRLRACLDVIAPGKPRVPFKEQGQCVS